MFENSQIPEPSREEIEELIKDGKKHPNYNKVVKRAKIMTAWYGANEGYLHDTVLKSEIVRKSSMESQADYDERLRMYPILPFEHKFIQAQQRIYDDNNVSREYASDFWTKKEKFFDDQGDDIDTFFKEKVLLTHELQGFGGIALDYAMIEGEPVTIDGKPVPYPYVVQASELWWFQHWYGMLNLVITCQKKEEKKEYRAFTPNFIYLFDEEGNYVTRANHNFKETPFIILKGTPDPESGYKVGLPRRWNISQVYMDVCDLFFDLKQGSLLFAHPVPIMHVDAVKEIAGVLDDDNKLIANLVKQELGSIITWTGEEAPKELFLQADMTGLDHLTQVIFDKLIPFVLTLASVRDKKAVHNVSGRSKQFDSVEEQGMLSHTASDMEEIEKNVFRIMYQARDEGGEATIVYNKHHDLRTADEIHTQFTELLQYGKTRDGQILIPRAVLEYLLTEFMKKSSASQEAQEELQKELEGFYTPLENQEQTE